MAGTVTVTRAPLVSTSGATIEKVQIDWLSDASGNADATVNLFGFLLKAVTDPGSAAPTASYDITIVQHGIDMAASLLADRHTTNSEIVYGIAKNASDIAPVPPFFAGDHTFTIANAGNAKNGTVYLYLIESL
jgi:hypothetical protein